MTKLETLINKWDGRQTITCATEEEYKELLLVIKRDWRFDFYDEIPSYEKNIVIYLPSMGNSKMSYSSKTYAEGQRYEINKASDILKDYIKKGNMVKEYIEGCFYKVRNGEKWLNIVKCNKTTSNTNSISGYYAINLQNTHTDNGSGFNEDSTSISDIYESVEVDSLSDEVQHKLPKNHSDRKKFKLGKILFNNKKHGERLPMFFTECDGIPKNKLVHGGITLHKDYGTEGAEIVGSYDRFYLVKFKDEFGDYVTIGFLEESLEESNTILASVSFDMEKIQEECKRRFPIGSTVENTSGSRIVLVDDDCIYKKHNNQIWASSSKGYLFDTTLGIGVYAKLISLPNELKVNPNISEYLPKIKSSVESGIKIKVRSLEKPKEQENKRVRIEIKTIKQIKLNHLN